MDVVDVDLAFVGIGAPGEGHVGAIGSGIARPEAGNFAALIVEFAAQFSRNIEHAGAAIVITHIENVVEDPDVMRAGFGDAVGSDLFGICKIADVDHMRDAAHGNSIVRTETKFGRKNFVADENIILIAIDGVSAGEPAGAIEFIVVDAKLRNELRVFGTAAFYSVANIENY